MLDKFETLDHGPQPLDALMTTHGLENPSLVTAAKEDHLTHKQVARARKGRRLTRHMQDKITRAFNLAAKSTLTRKDLFTYDGDAIRPPESPTS
jgi:hypothetical protein